VSRPPESRFQLASGASRFAWNAVDLNMHMSVSKLQSIGEAGGASLLDRDDGASSFSSPPRRKGFEKFFKELLEAKSAAATHKQSTGSKRRIMKSTQQKANYN
jgi:hypothetical protein